MPPRALLLLNPGARKGGEGLDEVSARLTDRGLDLVIEQAAHPAVMTDLVRKHASAVDRVIVGGGDGTLNTVVQALVETGLPLALLPLGTANNLARTLEIPTDLPQACDIAAGESRRRIDLGWVNGRYFFTTASLGLSVRITAQLSTDSKRRWGPLAYALTAARVVTRSRPFHAEIRWEGGVRTSRTVQIVVGNGRYYGAALAIAEDAAIDDARLDLYSLEVRRWWELLLLAPALKRGRHGERPQVEALRATRFEIRTRTPREIDIDGEIGARTPAEFRVMPSALQVFVPAPTS